MKKTKKLVVLALLLSQALVLHYVESFIPFPLPGVRLGLANITVLVALVLFGFRACMVLVVIKSIMAPLMGGNPMAILYSMAGGILSAAVMGMLQCRFGRWFSLAGISTAGAIFHNIGQLIVASVILENATIFFTYLPVLMISALITGFFIGLASGYALRFINHSGLFQQ